MAFYTLKYKRWHLDLAVKPLDPALSYLKTSTANKQTVKTEIEQTKSQSDFKSKGVLQKIGYISCFGSLLRYFNIIFIVITDQLSTCMGEK
jgi:hypothetical protein